MHHTPGFQLPGTQSELRPFYNHRYRKGDHDEKEGESPPGAHVLVPSSSLELHLTSMRMIY